mmetsp:Transcript_16561/g.28512  ORF Transcript_16561/g.28512 Transcript_16561/m.28512 type:complete len:268 (+) Transcript_16561:2506-3309(+)
MIAARPETIASILERRNAFKHGKHRLAKVGQFVVTARHELRRRVEELNRMTEVARSVARQRACIAGVVFLTTIDKHTCFTTPGPIVFEIAHHLPAQQIVFFRQHFGKTGRMFRHRVPVAELTSSSSIIIIMIATICNPKTCWFTVGAKQIMLRRFNGEIVIEHILALITILNKVIVTGTFITHVVFDDETMCAMNCNATLICMMNGTIFHIRTNQITRNMEMNRITCQFAFLTDISQFSILNTNGCFIQHHDVSTPTSVVTIAFDPH